MNAFVEVRTCTAVESLGQGYPQPTAPCDLPVTASSFLPWCIHHLTISSSMSTSLPKTRIHLLLTLKLLLEGVPQISVFRSLWGAVGPQGKTLQRQSTWVQHFSLGSCFCYLYFCSLHCIMALHMFIFLISVVSSYESNLSSFSLVKFQGHNRGIKANPSSDHE